MSDKPTKPYPRLEAASLTFTQEQDCCDDGAFDQEIEIKRLDGGGGPFFTIETKRWAFESVEELTGLIKNSIRRME